MNYQPAISIEQGIGKNFPPAMPIQREAVTEHRTSELPQGYVGRTNTPSCLADRAYTPALLLGTTTWVRLRKDDWPAAWVGLNDPIVPLVLGWYGHPRSRWGTWNDGKT